MAERLLQIFARKARSAGASLSSTSGLSMSYNNMFFTKSIIHADAINNVPACEIIDYKGIALESPRKLSLFSLKINGR